MKRTICYAISIIISLTVLVGLLSASASGIDHISAETLIPAKSFTSSTAAMKYALSPDHLYPFVYTGTPPSSWREINTADCSIGKLYVYNQHTNSITAIGDDNVITFVSTNNNLFYVTQSHTIIATDFSGSAFLPIYQAKQGSITMINAFGNYLYFVEDNKCVIVLDISHKTTYATISADSIISAYMFSPDKLIWYSENGEAYYHSITSQVSVPLPTEKDEIALITEHLSLETINSNAAPLSSIVVDNVGQADDYNDIAFPLANYPALKELGGYEPSAIYSRFLNDWEYGDPIPDVLDKTKYAGGASECDGFAKYAHDVFWHIDDWARSAPSWGRSGNYTADYRGSYSWSSKDQMIDFFKGLNRGAFVRYTSKADDTPGDGTHSYVFDGIDSDGLGTWHYECNQDFKCGIGYQNYTFDLYFSKNKCVFYYVDHTFASSASILDASRHTVSCNNCDGYLLPTHTGTSSFTQFTPAKHKVTVSCCDGDILENHVISGNACFACGYVDNSGLLLINDPQ